MIRDKVRLDICHELNYIIMGVTVSDAFVRVNLAKIFGRTELLSKREMREEEDRKRADR